ncbi:MAG: DnaJ domain-containing protein [Bacteroidetes bacterium]|nr:DnaJ domain-containing protein [Bacteroidota bacterium]
MPLKDYYKILGVAPQADLQEIKKVYRKLAFQYHPDTNKENQFTEAHFKEISEAYNTLSNSNRRKKYDEERWLAGMDSRMRREQHISPEWILQECKKLSKHMRGIDTYRMSHSSLRDYVLLILSDSHMAVLQQYKDADINHQIILELLQATARLEFRYMPGIAERLVLLAGKDNELLQRIYKHMEVLNKHEKRDKYMPLIIIIITLLLCVLMYFYGMKK